MIPRYGLRVSLLMAVLLLDTSGRSRAQDLTATMKGGEQWITRYETVEFVLSRPLRQEEQVSVVIGTTDVTALCAISGDTLRYRPTAAPLPQGAVTVSVFSVTPDGAWVDAGTYTLHVLTTTGLEKSSVVPALTLTNNGQVAEGHFPESPGPARARFQELNGQLALKTDVERAGVNFGLAANIVGVSFKQEALRFSEKGEDAAKIDLASYQIETRAGRTVLSAGHISHGRSRHLLSNYTSRGVAVTTAIGSFLDLSGSVLNATSIVGWDNFFGLKDARHRIYSGTIGLEVLPAQPGLVRFEGSYVHGSQLPLSGFTQAFVNDAEQSDGGSGRLLLSDPAKAITLDAGYTKTRFTNPVDPLLAQGFDIVPVEETMRNAWYTDVSWDIVRDASLLKAIPARLSAVFRHERVDPLYRAVGVYVRSDNLQNTYELHGGLGPVQMDITHLRSEDNLAEVASVLKTKTRQTGANFVLSPAFSGGLIPTWLPVLSYGLQSTHQFGVSAPTGSEFTPDRVPDQQTTTHSAGVEWQGSRMRAGYRGTITTQDNRQPGRENADAVSRTNGLSVGFTPAALFSVTVDGSLESAENTETGAILRNRRIGANLSLTLPAGVATNVNASLSSSGPDDGSSRQQQASFAMETSYAFDLSSSFVFAWRGRVFVRYSWNEVVSHDDVFALDTQIRAWAVNTGISFNLF